MNKIPYTRLNFPSTNPGRGTTQQRIVSTIIEEWTSGRLVPGSRLPPVRQLEQTLGISKNTVQSAYDELQNRGIVEAREREGYFVKLNKNLAGSTEVSPPSTVPAVAVTPAISLSHRPSTEGISLSTVFIDPDLLPKEQLADCMRSVLRTPGLTAHYDWQGYRPLRELIAKRLSLRGLAVQPDQVITTVGSQQALDILSRAMSVKHIALENPVYSHAKYLFAANGLTLTPLPLDPFSGIDLPRWQQTIATTRPAAFYAITSYQNPTGYSYTTQELQAILAMAREYNMGLIEDDWGSDMLSDDDYRPSLRALGGDQVVYINSFTKKLLPSLRIGFIVVPAQLVPSLVTMKRLSTLGNPTFLECVLAEFLDRGYYDTHLNFLQTELNQRYQHCIELLRQHMPLGVRWTLPGGGPTLWLDLPTQVPMQQLSDRLATHKVFIESTTDAFIGPAHLHGFRVSYAYLTTEQLEQALTLVGQTIKDFLVRSKQQ